MNNEFSFEHRRYKTIHYRANPRGIFMHYLTYIQKGHCGIETGGKTISAKEGDVFFIPKGLPYDIAPNEFKRKILCEKGIELLNTTGKAVEEISSILGLSSGSYFRKLLKRYTARTPKEIREVGMLYDIIV